jgi:poly-gamma-glutamate synthesis protein (capsule biosynthesis protein)
MRIELTRLAGDAVTLGLAGLLVAWAGLAAFGEEPPYRAPVFADSIPPIPSRSDLPRVQGGGTRIRIGFVGDLMQHEEQRRDDYRRSYALVAPRLRALQLAVGNLEFPVDSTLPVGPDPGTVRFNGSPAHLDAIADAGFDVLQVANNHANDRGAEGLLRTLSALEGRGIQAVGGAESPSALEHHAVVRDVGGIRLGFRAYTIPPNTYLDSLGVPEWASRNLPIHALDFDHWRDADREHGLDMFRRHAGQARSAGAEFVIALVHWGREYYLAPSEAQRRAAQDLVDAGFDLVVGTHSHVLVPPELYRGKLIVYSLGNFLSRALSPETAVGALLEVELARMGEGVGVADFAFRPTVVRKPGHVITPVDSTAGLPDAAAWAVARRVLGTTMIQWDAP